MLYEEKNGLYFLLKGSSLKHSFAPRERGKFFERIDDLRIVFHPSSLRLARVVPPSPSECYDSDEHTADESCECIFKWTEPPSFEDLL